MGKSLPYNSIYKVKVKWKFENTKDFLGRPIEDDPNYNTIRSLERGCGVAYLYLPPGIVVAGAGGGGAAILGLVIAVGVAAGGGGSGGTGSESSN